MTAVEGRVPCCPSAELAFCMNVRGVPVSAFYSVHRGIHGASMRYMRVYVLGPLLTVQNSRHFRSGWMWYRSRRALPVLKSRLALYRTSGIYTSDERPDIGKLLQVFTSTHVFEVLVVSFPDLHDLYGNRGRKSSVNAGLYDLPRIVDLCRVCFCGAVRISMRITCWISCDRSIKRT